MSRPTIKTKFEGTKMLRLSKLYLQKESNNDTTHMVPIQAKKNQDT